MSTHNPVEVDISFIEIKIRGSNKSSCSIEVIASAGVSGIYVYYPLGDNWDDVKKNYTFQDIMSSVGQTYEFGREAKDFIILSSSGHEGLYDIPICQPTKNDIEKK